MFFVRIVKTNLGCRGIGLTDFFTAEPGLGTKLGHGPQKLQIILIGFYNENYFKSLQVEPLVTGFNGLGLELGYMLVVERARDCRSFLLDFGLGPVQLIGCCNGNNFEKKCCDETMGQQKTQCSSISSCLG